MDCTIVDVFAERPLSGNQLAVVYGAMHLGPAEIQAIALETNFSETTFVVDEKPESVQFNNRLPSATIFGILVRSLVRPMGSFCQSPTNNSQQALLTLPSRSFEYSTESSH